MRKIFQYEDEEMSLRAAIAQRGPRQGAKGPRPPTSPPPEIDPNVPSGSGFMTRSVRTDSGSSLGSSDSSLKYDRHSISPTVIDTSLNGQNPFNNVPWHVMYSIFQNLELRDRIRASMVCKRWNSLLTDGRFPLDDLSVMNIFEYEILNEKMEKNIQSGGKVEFVQLSEIDDLRSIFLHCDAPYAVKIWFSRLDFLEQVLEKLSDCNVKFKSLDIYPYQEYIGLSLVHEYLPDLKCIGMRPHSKDHFFTGMPLGHFPKFRGLSSLTLDSFYLDEKAEFPAGLTTLDWQSRTETTISEFLERLKPLKKLNRLIMSHNHYSALNFLKLLEAIGAWNMPNLQYLAFKLATFHLDGRIRAHFVKMNNILRSLRLLRMELCYGEVMNFLNIMLELTGDELSVVSLTILPRRPEFPLYRIFEMSSEFARRGISLHLGIMQPSSDKEKKENNDQDEYLVEEVHAMGGFYNSFSKVLSVLDVSFLTDEGLLTNLLTPSTFPNLTEVKFIECDAVTDPILFKLAMSCPNLQRLSLLSCHVCTNAGIRQFVEFFHSRKSESLKINWQKDQEHDGRSAVTDFYMDLASNHRSLLDDLSMKSYRKQFRVRVGEQIVIWNEQKTLYIQDFDSYDKNRFLGIVSPPFNVIEDSDSSEEAIRFVAEKTELGKSLDSTLRL
ncbi:unnamed protein product [Bursaphelenchus xylophilus]|uniref:(pine wood nematode) hypothetical protein n=1 Tax=Bursaphelenchus xylophilus TaxID=6326 RepID=A0A1I7SLN5_BURXY|nr:unnamed protein product [Bursaphelenchus xylophilus]CAG9129682.1 unnamed protein product [Bursaphelenchus xylophilus]